MYCKTWIERLNINRGKVPNQSFALIDRADLAAWLRSLEPELASVPEDDLAISDVDVFRQTDPLMNSE